MTYLLTILIIGAAFSAMAIGLLVAKKVLRRGCSIDPDSCACRREGKPICEDEDQPPSKSSSE